MKIFIPRHITWGLFNMNIQVWPINMTMVQLFIIAAGVAISLAIWKQLVDGGVSKVISITLVAPVLMIFLGIAFFKFTELTLLPFIAKIVRTNFLDETRKFQLNFEKIDPVNVKVKILKASESQQVIETKKNLIDKDKIENLKGLV